MRAARGRHGRRDEGGRVGQQVGRERLRGAPWRCVRSSCACISRSRGSATSVGIGTIITETRLPNVPICLLGAHRHGDHRHQRLLGQLAAGEQPLAHRGRAERDDDVVDGDAELVLERLDGVERERAEREAPVRRDRAVEARLGRPRGRDLEQPPPSRRRRAGAGRGMRALRLRHAGDSVGAGQSAAQSGPRPAATRSARSGWRGRPSRPRPSISSSPGARSPSRLPPAPRDLAALGARVEQHAEDLVAGHAVDHRVVDLRQQRRRGRPASRGSGTAPTAGASGRAAGRRCAPRSRRAGGRRRAAARPSRGCGSRGRSPGPRSSTGRSSPNGTPTRRQRNGGTRCRRSETIRQRSASSSLPPGAVEGSKTAKPPTCP